MFRQNLLPKNGKKSTLLKKVTEKKVFNLSSFQEYDCNLLIKLQGMRWCTGEMSVVNHQYGNKTMDCLSFCSFSEISPRI